MPAPLQQAHIECAENLVKTGSQRLRQQFRKQHTIHVKEDGSLVTSLDFDIEAAWHAEIKRVFPEHGILGEELPPHNIDAQWLWSLDPLDGTSAFLSGSPLFGLLVGLCYQSTPCYGIIHIPALQEQWQGGVNHPTTFQGAPCLTRQHTSLDKALLYATTPSMFSPREWQQFQHLSARCLATRYGIDCYAYGLLASGSIDIVAEASMKPCDYLALAPVVAAAGGVITDWQGMPLSLQSDGTVLACSNKQLHEHALHALALLQGS